MELQLTADGRWSGFSILQVNDSRRQGGLSEPANDIAFLEEKIKEVGGKEEANHHHLDTLISEGVKCRTRKEKKPNFAVLLNTFLRELGQSGERCKQQTHPFRLGHLAVSNMHIK